MRCKTCFIVIFVFFSNLAQGAETTREQASRLYPAIVSDVNLPKVLYGDQTITLRWKILSFEDDFKSKMDIRLCLFGAGSTGFVGLDCDYGYENGKYVYQDPNPIATSGFLQKISKASVPPHLSYKGISPYEYSYEYSFKIPNIQDNSSSQYVLGYLGARVFGKSQKDELTELPGATVVIPGGLGGREPYLNKNGRVLLTEYR